LLDLLSLSAAAAGAGALGAGVVTTIGGGGATTSGRWHAAKVIAAQTGSNSALYFFMTFLSGVVDATIALRALLPRNGRIPVSSNPCSCDWLRHLRYATLILPANPARAG
jgi:hypothetical protein